MEACPGGAAALDFGRQESKTRVKVADWIYDMANRGSIPLSHVAERDFRLDFLRGLGLWMIVLDHIPDDVVSWLTLRSYGFSDAAEFFNPQSARCLNGHLEI
jgi:hypothetical protein